jgi:DNA-directed RNA polymerase specialized sigma24 family protein
MREVVHNALSALPDDERDAVRLLYLEELTGPEAQHRSGVPARQLRTHAARGLARLRDVPELAEWR